MTLPYSPLLDDDHPSSINTDPTSAHTNKKRIRLWLSISVLATLLDCYGSTILFRTDDDSQSTTSEATMYTLAFFTALPENLWHIAHWVWMIWMPEHHTHEHPAESVCNRPTWTVRFYAANHALIAAPAFIQLIKDGSSSWGPGHYKLFLAPLALIIEYLAAWADCKGHMIEHDHSHPTTPSQKDCWKFAVFTGIVCLQLTTFVNVFYGDGPKDDDDYAHIFHEARDTPVLLTLITVASLLASGRVIYTEADHVHELKIERTPAYKALYLINTAMIATGIFPTWNRHSYKWQSPTQFISALLIAALSAYPLSALFIPFIISCAQQGANSTMGQLIHHHQSHDDSDDSDDGHDGHDHEEQGLTAHNEKHPHPHPHPHLSFGPSSVPTPNPITCPMM